MQTSDVRLRLSAMLLAFVALVLPAPLFAEENNKPPAGFSALFNGRDFEEWTGALTEDPQKIAAMPPDERSKRDAEMKKGIHEHWHVDNGELVSDGKDPYLATPRDYGDFEMWVDWKIGADGDSGIYLRGAPQVQIWDPHDSKPNIQALGAGKGSGALWNNQQHTKYPPEVADKPVGEWNRMYIRVVGPYVLVKLNDKVTADNVFMENYYNKDPSSPVASRGPIYLQTHGSETRFRNVFVREIPADESNKILSEIRGGETGFEPIFNGQDLAGWKGGTDGYEVVDGELHCKPGQHGNLFTDDIYDNFVIRYEFKLPPGGNNGLAIRSPEVVGDAAYDGMELQILDDTAPQYENLHEYQFCGSLYGLAPAKRGHLRPVGEWNYEEAVVDGDHLEVHLNGFEVLNVDIAKAREKPIDGKAHPGASRTNGHIGFCGHIDPVALRNLRVKRLPPK